MMANIHLWTIAMVFIAGASEIRPGYVNGGSGSAWEQSSVIDIGPAAVTSGQVRQIQEALNREFWAGLVVDGVWGPQTQDALERFQAQSGLPVTGVPDTLTEQALGLATPLRLERMPASLTPEQPMRIDQGVPLRPL